SARRCLCRRRARVRRRFAGRLAGGLAARLAVGVRRLLGCRRMAVDARDLTLIRRRLGTAERGKSDADGACRTEAGAPLASAAAALFLVACGGAVAVTVAG